LLSEQEKKVNEKQNNIKKVIRMLQN